MHSDYILELRGIDKSFPGVKALDQMHFKLREASVHALLGENGAGKSTLMKILSGVYQKDNGEMLIDGKPLVCSNPLEAQSAGISIIYQELNLCWNLTVAENIFLGREPVRKFGYYRKTDVAKAAGNILKSLDVEHIDPNVVVSALSIANQQMVEIAKAISVNAKILIMDEPTSSLTEKETDILFTLIKNLKKQGVSIIYISHKLEEIYDICDQVTVIRDGKWIEDFPISEATNNRIIELMVGRPMDMVFPQKLVSDSEEVENSVIRVENLHKHGLVSDISFSVAPGEILGVSGLVGAGRTEMAKTLFGAIEKDRGQIFLEGKEIIINSPQDAIRLGIALITEDRKLEGLFLGLSVKDNILASNLEMVLKSLGFINRAQERELVDEAVKKLNVKTPSLESPVSGLSGGNQQKMIISRWLAKHVKVLIMDEPTRGIDVGAKKAIYDIMRMLSKEGIAIIMISSELPEILGMSDRIAVMRSGRIVKIIPGNEASQTLVMKYAAEGGN